jgi:hypothetical protein
LASQVRHLFAEQNTPLQIQPGFQPSDTPPDRMPASLWLTAED